MSDAVVYEQLDQEAQPADAAHGPVGAEGNGVHPGAGSHEGADLRRLSDVPMELSVEIGRTRMTVGETLQLRAGSIVKLERLAGEPVDLLVNGTPIARGEVVIVDEEFGMRVTEIVESDAVATGLGGREGDSDAGDPLDAGGGDGTPINPIPAPPADTVSAEPDAQE
jgi:flagellar motor switch protein FliN